MPLVDREIAQALFCVTFEVLKSICNTAPVSNNLKSPFFLRPSARNMAIKNKKRNAKHHFFLCFANAVSIGQRNCRQGHDMSAAQCCGLLALIFFGIGKRRSSSQKQIECKTARQ